MKIVRWPAFAALPAGTLFCFCYRDRSPKGHICVKAETLTEVKTGGADPRPYPVDFSFMTIGPCVAGEEARLASEPQLYSDSFRCEKLSGESLKVRRFAVLEESEIRAIERFFAGAPYLPEEIANKEQSWCR